MSISSTSSSISTREISKIVDQLRHEQHRNSTQKNYYTVWKLFNKFFIRLDRKPKRWEDGLNLFVGYLVDSKNQSSTVRSYISAIKAVLRTNKIKIQEDQYLLSAMTKACKLKNDRVKARLPIQKAMLSVIIKMIRKHFYKSNQPYLAALYKALLLMNGPVMIPFKTGTVQDLESS